MRPLMISMAAGLLIACGGEPPPDATTTQAVVDDAAGPCALLTPEDVAAVIGPLAGAPYRARGTTPDAGGDLCRFENAELRSLVVGVTWEGGADELRILGMVSGIVNTGDLGELRLIDGTALAGEWDEARVVGCCELKALRGDQLVRVDVAGTEASLEDAAKLADAAIRRLDTPLAHDDRAAVAAAVARESERPRIRAVCELVSRADAEELAGRALTEEPVGDETSCAYRGDALDLTVNVQWRDGFRDLQVIAATIGATTSFIGLPADGGEPEQGPWDEFSSSIAGVMAVQRDVLVSVETGPFAQEMPKAFVARAIENLTADGAASGR